MSEGTKAPANKVVIVSGHEFLVPADQANEAIRDYLASNFPDVAKAEIQDGTKVIDGVTYPTIEFVKKAGTKGLDGGDLAELLGQVPARRLPKDSLDRSAAALIRRFEEGRLTFGEALRDRRVLIGALESICEGGTTPLSEGAGLCDSVERIPAAPCTTLFGW